MAGLESIINTKFLGALAAYGDRNSKSSSLSVKSKNGAEPAVSVALRTGALTYATAIGGLNTAATFLNIAKDNLGKLDTLVDKMLQNAEAAKRAGTGSSTRKQLDVDFHRLANEFEEIVSNSVVQGINYMTKDGLAQILGGFGLDPNASSTVKEVFDEIETPKTDSGLASEDEKGRRPIPIPEDAFRIPTSLPKKTTEYDSLFDRDRHITNRPDAYRLVHDLKALKGQISENTKALDDATALVVDNMKLVRGTGLAFLDLANTLTDFSDANAVARLLREKIRQNAGGALAQAENLQPIAVAALLRNQNS